MTTLKLRSHIGPDGMLELSCPPAFGNGRGRDGFVSAGFFGELEIRSRTIGMANVRKTAGSNRRPHFFQARTG